MATRLTVVGIVGQIRAELDRILEAESSLPSGLGDDADLLPRVDISHTESNLCLLVEVPGVKLEDLEVSIVNNVATVSGNRRAVRTPAPGARFLRVERQWGRFERSVELPSPVNADQGRALLEDGVLRIELPLLSDQRNRTYRLSIQAGGGDSIE